MDQGQLKLDNQLCFSLYRLSKLMVAKYRPILDEIDLTYPQYLAMMVIWENQNLSVKELGQKLSLDSGTLTPLLKRLIAKGLVQKKRSKEDERIVLIALTDEGINLKKRALEVPAKIACSTEMNIDELRKLKTTLDELYTNWTED